MPELSSGIRFDEKMKKWTYGHFSTDGKSTVITIKWTGRVERDYAGTTYTVSAYSVQISKPGEPYSTNTCQAPDGSESLLVHSHLGVFCMAGLFDYRFYLHAMRFMEIYPRGYVDGVDASADDPTITVGKCSRIQ